MKREQAFFHDASTFFAVFFNWSWKNLCFFVGRRPFWGFFGLSKARGLAKAKKSPKRPKAYKKTQILTAEVEKTAKKWTNHKSLLSFHLWDAILFTCSSPWIHFFTLRMSFRGVTISYSPESPENIMHAIYNMYFYVVILCPMYAIFICILAQVFF